MTQLASAVDAVDKLWTLDVLPPSPFVQVDDELIEISATFPEQIYEPTQELRPPKVRVRRAVAGTTAASHAEAAELVAVYGIGDADVSFSAIAIEVDLAEHPNTEDAAVVEYDGVTISGPAWVEGRFVVTNLVDAVGGDRVEMAVFLLSPSWESGETNAVLLVSSTGQDSSDSFGGILVGTSPNTKFFVPAAMEARVGIRVQPRLSGQPHPGQAAGLLTVQLVVATNV